jgi:Domain of unknown function (DUF4405)
MTKKNLISLSVAFSFLALSVTGILIYLKQSPHSVKITHTIFGLVFVGFAIFHILNNWSSIVAYSREKKGGKYQKEFWVAGAISVLLLIGSLTEILEPIAEAGRFFAEKKPRVEKLSFDQISTNKDVKGTHLSLMIQKAKGVDFPVMAIWVEDSAHQLVENLFVPAHIAVVGESEEAKREAKGKGEFEKKPFSADVLPTFKTKTTATKTNFDKVTPMENFILDTQTSANGAFTVYLEVKNKDKTELYEATIDASKSDVFKLKSKDNSMITKVLVELK